LAGGLIEILDEKGLANRTVMGVSYGNWLNLGLSLVIVLIGYLLSVLLVRRLLPSLARRTATNLADRLLVAAGNLFDGLAIVLMLKFAANRLVFLPAGLKSWLNDAFFLVGLFLLVAILWRLIGLAVAWIEGRAVRKGYEKEANSLLKWVIWPVRLMMLLIAFSALLTHYAINVTGITIILGIIVLVVSLAAR